MKVRQLKEYIGDRKFLKMVSIIAIPIILQQLVENLVSLADSIMISGFSSIGVSAVQIGSQWESIVSLFGFGTCSGVGIYTAQFIGSKDNASLKKSFGTMILLATSAAIPFILLAFMIPEAICGFFISEANVIQDASTYLTITSLSFIFIVVSYSYNYTYRCMGKTKVSMYVSAATVLINCALNYVLIYGKLGLPSLGIVGAALATLISRGLGTLMYIVYSRMTHQPFLGTFKEMFGLTRSFLLPIMKRITPTVLNEAFFGIGQSLYFKAYGMLGSTAITSVAIADRIGSLFFMVVWAITTAVQTIVGNQLGAGNFEKARHYARNFMGLGAITSVILGLGMALTAPLFVEVLYPMESAEIHRAAIAILAAFAIKICLRLFNSIIFGCLRCGGDTKVLAMLDSVILYTVGLPVAFLSVAVFHLSIVPTIFLIQLEQLIRIILAYRRYRSGKWIQNITTDVS